MIKHLALKLIRYRIKSYLPKVNLKIYKKLFNLSYKFFVFLKPSQLWVIVLALLNKTEFKKLVSLPSMLILFNTLFLSDSSKDIKIDSKLNTNLLFVKLETNNFTDSENNWEKFFWVLIILAIFKRFTVTFFKLLWIPFKIALIYYILKYLGFDFKNIYNTLNNLSLGIIDWFYDKIVNFLNSFKPDDKNN